MHQEDELRTTEKVRTSPSRVGGSGAKQIAADHGGSPGPAPAQPMASAATVGVHRGSGDPAVLLEDLQVFHQGCDAEPASP
jgi:hypothetical protein